jgi:hypothetical protein
MAAPFVPNYPALSFAEIVFDHLTARFPRPLLLICDFSDECCDCREKATIHLIETEEDLCLRHFEKRLKENL